MKKEIEFIHSLIKNYPRSKNQINYPFHSDAEVLKTKNGFLGVSVDAISEEIDLGLIVDPETLGWLTVTASASDLSAIGFKTDKISVLLKEAGTSKEWQDKFFKGVRLACDSYEIGSIEEIFQNGGQTLAVATAYGTSENQPVLSRVGLEVGDSLFLTGPVGWGNAVAMANLAIRKMSPDLADLIDKSYRPKARIKEAQIIKQYSKVCIDTSDGLLSTLKWLELYNNRNLKFNYTKSLFHPIALDVAEKTKVDPWLFFASQNGEFELLFSISPDKKAQFKDEAAKNNFSFLEIGEVREGEGLTMLLDNVEKDLKVDHLLDMLQEGVPPEQYIMAMLQFAHQKSILLKDK